MDLDNPIYLDYNGTTPVDPRVVEAMLPFLGEHFGNPSSSHAYGAPTHRAGDAAREQVAALLGCSPEEIVFTGGGSESDNQAIKGVAFAMRRRGDHIGWPKFCWPFNKYAMGVGKANHRAEFLEFHIIDGSVLIAPVVDHGRAPCLRGDGNEKGKIVNIEPGKRPRVYLIVERGQP